MWSFIICHTTLKTTHNALTRDRTVDWSFTFYTKQLPQKVAGVWHGLVVKEARRVSQHLRHAHGRGLTPNGEREIAPVTQKVLYQLVGINVQESFAHTRTQVVQIQRREITPVGRENEHLRHSQKNGQFECDGDDAHCTRTRAFGRETNAAGGQSRETDDAVPGNEDRWLQPWGSGHEPSAALATAWGRARRMEWGGVEFHHIKSSAHT